MVLLLTGCGSGSLDVGDAVDRAETAFEARPSPHQLYRVSLDHPDRWEHSSGTPVAAGRDLRAWLAACPVPPGAEVRARLLLRAGGYPWETRVAGVEEAFTPCLSARLAELPFEEPIHAGTTDVVVLRWTVDAPAGPWSTTRGPGAGTAPEPRHLPPGAVSLATSGDIPAQSLVVEDGRVRFRVDGETRGAVDLPEAETLARLVTCTDDTYDLTRLVLLIRHGRITSVHTDPPVECVEAAVRHHRELILALPRAEGSGARLGDAPAVIVRVDVPLGGW